MKIIRLFPRKTKATPDDSLAVINRLPELFDEADEVHISVAWTWDIPKAEKMEKMWRFVAPVRIGGPATGERGGAFVPGMYIKDGYTITSRGCPNRCWFCSVWRREGDATRELPICDGWNILDDNLLACSDDHIRAVFAMLKRQNRKAEFTGGLEAARLKPWHAEAMREIKAKQMFFAYDTPDDLEPLREAGKIMQAAGHHIHPRSHALRCYVLCGYRTDTISKANKRIAETIEAGFSPMAMVIRDEKTGLRDKQWGRWARQYSRLAIAHSKQEKQQCN